MMRKDQINQKLDQTKEQFNQQEQEEQQVSTSSIIPYQQQTSDALLQKNENQISIVINVSRPMEIKNSQFKSYKVYTIEGSDAWGKFKTERRFKEFQALRLSLKKFWIGFYNWHNQQIQYSDLLISQKDCINQLERNEPCIHSTSFRKNSKSKQGSIKREAQNIKLFCKKNFLSLKSKIYSYTNCNEGQLTSKEREPNYCILPNETEICKVLESLKPPDILYQIYVVKQVFQINSEQYDEQKLQIQLKNVQTFLYNSKFLLFKLSRKIQEMIDNSKKQKEQINSVIGAECEQSEKFVMQDSIENQNGKMKSSEIGVKIRSNLENMIQTRDIYIEKIHDLIKTEQMDIDAFLEGFQRRSEMVSQQKYDRAKLNQWEYEKYEIEYLSPNDKCQLKYIQENLNQCNKEISKFNHFNLLMMNLEVTKIFEKFKHDQHQFYLKIIKDISNLELQNLSIMQQNWKSIENLAQLKLDKKINYQMSL